MPAFARFVARGPSADGNKLSFQGEHRIFHLRFLQAFKLTPGGTIGKLTSCQALAVVL